jgi:hypothetical protein
VPLAACANGRDQLPLIFARTQTLGATIGGSAPDQGAQLTLGYGDRNLAVVPTTTSSGKSIRGNIERCVNGQWQRASDSLSVLGQFSASENTTKVKMGTFFATGQAASKLADGFARQLGWMPEEGQTGNGGGGPPPPCPARTPDPVAPITGKMMLPLVYARIQTFGASAGATVPDQGASVNVGFSDRNLAVVPTTTPDGEQIRGSLPLSSDSLSVLGQFQATASSDEISLGTFFSTGNAASKLADGFKAGLSTTDDKDAN